MSTTGEAVGTRATLPPARSLGERLLFALLRIGAGMAAFDGIAMLTAAVPTLSMTSDDPRMSAVSRGLVSIAVAFFASGLVVRWLLGSRFLLLPNERVENDGATPFGGWLLALLVALLMLPFSTLYELAPLRSLWTDVIALAREHRVFDGVMRNSQMSGFVLMPIAAALAVPTLEVFAAGSFVAGSALLTPLLLMRSCRFPRAYLACTLLQGTLVFASIYGAEIARDIAAWVADGAGGNVSFVRTEESVQVLDAIARYDAVLAASSRSLAWTLVGYAVWLVPLVASERARRTFAVPHSAT